MNPKTDRIVALAKQGHPPRAIVLLTDANINSVYNAIRYARSQGDDIPAFSKKRAKAAAAKGEPEMERRFLVAKPLLGVLRAHAEKHKLTPSEAANRILEAALLFHERTEK